MQFKEVIDALLVGSWISLPCARSSLWRTWAVTTHRAALALHISQPALSRSIAALESTLGVRLFDRSRAAVLPTPFGTLLVERGRSLIGELGALSKEIESLRGLESGELRIGAGLYPAEISLGTAVGRLSVRYPGIRVSLQAVQWREVIALVTAGEVDVAVVELSPFQDESRMALEPLPRHPVAFICRPGHPLLRERRPSITRPGLPAGRRPSAPALCGERRSARTHPQDRSGQR
jgi:DNA-binding transcriptional LysR family regulator